MYSTEWVELTDDNPETTTSSFIQEFMWRTKDPDPEDEETYGELVVWIDNDDDGLNLYAYPNVQREVFEELRDEAYNGYTPGQAFNRLVRSNGDIDEPQKRVLEQSSD